ncbi:MAG: tetratricopeptide repeat protein [Bacteroidota bacterium]
MASDYHPSLVLLACANSFQSGKPLKLPLQERRSIARILEMAEDQGWCSIIQEDAGAGSSFLELLQKHSFKKNVSILHIVGPLSPTMEDFDASGLSETVGKFPDLKMIFLNGCANLSVIEMMLLRNIPVVIATSSLIPDHEATLVAETFYKRISNGSSLKEAFHITNQLNGDTSEIITASYDLDTDRIQWEDFPGLKPSSPNIFLLQENEMYLDWSLAGPTKEQRVSRVASFAGPDPFSSQDQFSASSLISREASRELFTGEPSAEEKVVQNFVTSDPDLLARFAPKEEAERPEPKQFEEFEMKVQPEVAPITPSSDDQEIAEIMEELGKDSPNALSRLDKLREKEKEKKRLERRKRPLQIAVSSIITIVVGVALYQYFLFLKGSLLMDKCAFQASDKRYNVVLLTASEDNGCNTPFNTYANLVGEEVIKYQGSLINLDQQSFNGCRESGKEAGTLFKACYTNLMLWGDYAPLTDDSALVRLYYLTTSEITHDPDKGVFEEVVSTEDPIGIPPKMYEKLMVVLGAGMVEKREYDAAIHFLSQVPLRDEKDYIPIDYMMANAYMRMNDYSSAESHYNHILQIDPENLEALNAKGSLIAHQGRFEEAISDFNEIIEIDPEFTEAYYNRGLVYLRQNEYEEAVSDVERVIHLEPNQGKAYGVLAAIYAQQREHEPFYHNLEVALKAGLDIRQFVAHTAMKDYKEEPRFKKLVEKYRFSSPTSAASGL